LKRVLTIIIILSLQSIVIFGCTNKSSKEMGNLNIYIDVKDSHSTELIKYMLDEFGSKNKNIKIEYVNKFLGSNSDTKKGKDNLIDSLSKGKVDMLITNRNNMIELTQKGLLADISLDYEKYDLNKNSYTVITNYSRYQDKYYGISLFPYVLEVLYNQKSLNELNVKVPKNISDLALVINKLHKGKIKIPYILSDDMDINSVIMSSVSNNKINTVTLEDNYGKDINKYNIIDFQHIFDQGNILYKAGIINSETLEKGGEESIDGLNRGSFPFLILPSYFNDRINSADVQMLDSNSDIGIKLNLIGVSTILTVPTNSKNVSEVKCLIKFISKDFQTDLVKKATISDNKESNKKLIGLNSVAEAELYNADINNMLLQYDLPLKLNSMLSMKISNILKGNYNGKEWMEIVNSYK